MKYEVERLDHLIFGLENFCNELDGTCTLKPGEKNVLISLSMSDKLSQMW